MISDQVAAANEDYRAAFVGLTDLVPGGEARQSGHVATASAGLPVPEYNRASVFEPPAHDDLEAAVSWLNRREVPFG